MDLYKEELLGTFPLYADLKEWFANNHSTQKSLWIKFAKKSSSTTTVTYEEARELALIYGWIDGVKNKFDENYFVLRFTPRRPKSVWSQVNKEIVEDLIKQGKMHVAGLLEVEKAKKDGRWEAAYASASKITIPEDLQQALDKNPDAKEFFNKLNSANRYAILYRLHNSKKPETRQANLAKFIEMLNKKETIHSQKKFSKLL